MAKHLMLIHGRSFKPAEAILKTNWLDVIEFGLARDGYKKALAAYANVKVTFVYYGDISNEFLREHVAPYDEKTDSRDRKECLKRLKAYEANDFLEDKGKENYHKLPGISCWKEVATDLFSWFADTFGFAEWGIRQEAPDIAHYWNPDTEFGSDVRWKLTKPLRDALLNGDDIMLVSHSLGTIISYDVLWKFSYYGEYHELRKAGTRLNKLVTLGSPLGNETVMKKLKGGSLRGKRRYPTLIENWENFAAKCDYISHDETLADDYGEMLRLGIVGSIRDHRIYNLAVRNEASNPHHGVGYLIHPQVTEVLANWLSS